VANKFTPIFEDDEGNKFVMPYKDLVVETRAAADQKGMEVMFGLLLEGTINVAYVEPLEFSEIGNKSGMDLPNFSAKLGKREVAVFAGPAFDRQMKNWEAMQDDRHLHDAEISRKNAERAD
jgi:hypothetical protein